MGREAQTSGGRSISSRSQDDEAEELVWTLNESQVNHRLMSRLSEGHQVLVLFPLISRRRSEFLQEHQQQAERGHEP